MQMFWWVHIPEQTLKLNSQEQRHWQRSCHLYSDFHNSWNSINTCDVQRMSWNILSPLIFCVKSTLQYFNCTQQPYTTEKQPNPEPAQREIFFSSCKLVKGCQDSRAASLHHFWVWPLSLLTWGWKELYLWNNFNMLRTDTWGKRYRSMAEEGNKCQGDWRLLVKEGLFEPQEANQK